MADREIPVRVGSIFGMQLRTPIVELFIGDRRPFQISPAEARRIATLLIEAAEAADQDAFMVTFATDQLGLDLPAAARLLGEFRAFRQAEDARNADAR